MHPFVSSSLRKGMYGAAAGGAAGFVLALAATAINMVFNAGPPPPLFYQYKKEQWLFSGLEKYSDLCLDEDLKVVDEYRAYDADAHGVACRAVQRFLELHDHYEKLKLKGRSGITYIARMQKAAKKADSSFRKLLFTLKTINFQIAADDVEKAIMNIHFTFEKLIALAREHELLLVEPVKPQMPQKL
jgi:hypothetical protein